MEKQKLFLGTGVMKAGTTWLYGILKDHPEIYFCPEKEIHFWSDYAVNSNYLTKENRLQKVKQKLAAADKSPNYNHYRRLLRWSFNYLNTELSIDWYRKLFINNPDKAIYNADFSNVTSHINKEGWELAKSSCEKLKVIYVLRDPLSRLWSHIKFHHQFSGRKLDFETWSEYQFKDFITKPFIWMNCEYSKWINIMNTSLTSDQFKIFYFEDFRQTPIESLRSLESFLEISAHPYNEERLLKKVNPSVSIEMPSAFLKAAKPLLSKEIKRLQKLNIPIHPQWGSYT